MYQSVYLTWYLGHLHAQVRIRLTTLNRTLLLSLRRVSCLLSDFHLSVSFLYQEDVINTQCGYDARQKPEVDQQIVIYTKGCVPQFEKWLQDNLTIVAGIFIGIALLQIFGICLAQNLVSDIEAVRASW